MQVEVRRFWWGFAADRFAAQWGEKDHRHGRDETLHAMVRCLGLVEKDLVLNVKKNKTKHSTPPFGLR